ncbi:MAG TPA: TonB-dependent receptor [Candidatus Parabacteroides intestinigallinarum]|uniref:TonB-dependent receptor n=1 Tax=Candidatus Parabacteroides intestinigallinarum TaxID=2838722 RepID=A0A9D1XPG2_9BACT|nr:TonB-dependent receptor [Candidatus Parabacteroides intestinigallinarum]
MTKKESKPLSFDRIAKASVFCLLFSAFSVNTAMAVPVSTEESGEVSVVQQGKKVTGVVVDGAGIPVIGANVIVKGTTNGTITDFDGNFTLENVPADGVLVVSYIGYLSQEIPVGNQSAINVTLKEDTQALDEVVVVGYGTMRKSDVTGSISTAKGEDMLKAQNFSALDNLRGKAAGVNIFSNSSQPGAYGSRVVIRGQATINASSDPLYVVDGVVMENFYLMNPNDIESMEVLKDASATAIYGARGANGVIMVTTKRGKKGDKGVQVSYAGSVSVAHRASKMNTMNAQEWCDAFMEGIENENKWGGTNWSTDRGYWFSDSRFFDADGNPLYDTDWQDESTRVAVSHNHQLNIQQAGDKSSMGAFLNFTDQQGIMLNTYSKRLNAKIAYDADPTKWLSTSVNLSVNHTWGNSTTESGGSQDARRTMIEMLPWLPVTYDGEYTSSNTPNVPMDFESMANPVHILETQKNMNYNTKIFGNAALTFHLLEGLDLKTQFGVDANLASAHKYTPSDLNNLGKDQRGVAERYYGNTLYWQEETYLTYNKTWDEHRLNTMAGLSWQERTYNYSWMKSQSFDTDIYQDYNMEAGTNPSSPDTYYERWAMNSYFLRLAYTYKDRYSITATGRYDGSSKFGENNKYAFFPSAGLAWNVTQEDFLKNNNVLSNLKLHTSYGLTGNSEIGVYKSLATITSGTLLLNGTRSSYSKLGTLANSDLKWEKTAQFDIGFDIGFFQNRITLDASYYNKKTTDLLLNSPVPHTTGFKSVYENVGSIRNQGLDLMLTTHNIDNKDFSWTTTINANFNKNKILSLGENDADILMNEWVNGASILRVGESVGSFYGYKRYGIYTEEDYEAGNCAQNEIGRPKRSSEREIIGKGVPDWTGSMINTLRWKNWDFTLDLQFVAGVQTLQQFYHSTMDRFGQTNGLADILNGYNGTGDGGMQPAIWLINGGHSNQDTMTDSYWVANGSYLRANLIQLGYTFDSTQLAKTPFSSLRIYFNVNNAFLIHAKDFKGYDPESTSQISTSNGVTSADQFGQNMTFFSYPRARTFTLGLNVTF